jgi:hypothetical protein
VLTVAVELPEVEALKVVVPGPETCVHAPVPTVGVLPPNDELVNPHDVSGVVDIDAVVGASS